MKLTEAVIRPEKLDIVKNALSALSYPGMTITQVEDQGNQKGISEMWQEEYFRLFNYRRRK